MEFCMKMQNPRVMAVELENFQNFETQDSVQPPSWKLLYRHISVRWSIVWDSNENHVTKIQNFKLKISDERLWP